ncbi:MAG: J domain-containing protein [Synergistaceae bacterium]|nr:J domain-containing protein [Synergistaceae bacterium]
MKFFADCATIDELKCEYRRLVMPHHPDRGEDVETMKRVNEQYAERLEWIRTSSIFWGVM